MLIERQSLNEDLISQKVNIKSQINRSYAHHQSASQNANGVKSRMQDLQAEPNSAEIQFGTQGGSSVANQSVRSSSIKVPTSSSLHTNNSAANHSRTIQKGISSSYHSNANAAAQYYHSKLNSMQSRASSRRGLQTNS